MRWLATILLLVCPVVAAPLRGLVRGGGIPLPGATVTARQGAASASTVTAADGSFAFADLAAGVWTIEVTMPGFVAAQTQVTIPASGPTALDLAIAPYHGPALAAAPTAPAASATAAAPTAAPDALAVNGSVDNGATSPFALSPAFGNNRPRLGSMYNGGVGLIFDSSALDARSYSLTGQPTPKPGYNNFTGLFQFGGPLVIPHLLNLNNAPMVFVAYEHGAALNAVNTSALVPTAAERGGNLSALGGPAVASISPQAAALLAFYPLPNASGGAGYNYQTALLSHQHQDRLQLRVNKGFTRDQFASSLSLSSTRGDSSNLFGFLDTQRTLGLDASLTLRHTFTQFLYATFGVDYSRLASQATPFFANRANVAATAGIAGGYNDPAFWGPPTLSFADGFAALSDGSPAHNRNQTAAYSVSAYWNHYSHNITFGGDLRRLEFNYFDQQNPRGSFNFNGYASGEAFGDFLQGLPATAALAYGNADKYFRESGYDLFFDDDWRLADSLTLDLGGRWEYTAPITERYGRQVNLDVAGHFAAAAPVVGSDPVGSLTATAYPSSLLRPDKSGLEPRLGLAWRPQPASSLLLRAGYGIYRDTSVYQSLAIQMAQQAPLSTSLSVAATAAAPLALANALLTPPGATPTLFAVDPNFRIGYAQDWNASLQRDLPDGMVMTLSYLGTKGTRGAQRYYPNTFPPGAANPCPACPVGFLYEASNGNSTYESGKAQIQRRFHNGLAATVTYTYAHAMDDSARGGGNQSAGVVAQDWTNLDAERARSSFDQRHNLSVVAQYSTGSGIRGGALMSGWRGALFKGWTLTTQVTAGSGLPLTPLTFAVVPGTGFTGVRPDATGLSPAAAPAGRFVNPAAFAAPAPGAWGTAGRNSVEGPRQFSMNAAMQRSFPLGSRLTANLRIDATNLLNHAAYTSYNLVFGNPQFGLPSAANPMRSLQTTLRVDF
ncbi:MAG TPA: TonB-dependent receptor [Terriglobales bacterium]|nr:TonB-dependent receptor [Terriglobales bacterium]